MLTHLAAKSVSVALPIAGKYGRRMPSLLAPEGRRAVVLFTYVEGTPLSWSDESHIYLAGQLADAPLVELRPPFTHRPDDWLYVEALAAKLRAAIGTARCRLDWGVATETYTPETSIYPKTRR